MRSRHAIAGVACAASLVVVAAGCTSNSTSDKASAEVPGSVRSTLNQYSRPVQPNIHADAFDASPAQGSTVWWVAQSTANPFLAMVGANFRAALQSQGVDVEVCDGKNNPVDVGTCIDQALAQQADAIQVDGPEASTYREALDKAKAKGVPVFSGAAVDASSPLAPGLAGQSSQPFVLSGQLLADWVTQDSGGDANVLFITTPDVIGSVQEQKAFSAELDKVCKSCDVKVKGVTLANWATDIGTVTNAELLRNPKLDYVVPAFDPMVQFTNPAIQQAGKGGSVKVASVNGSLQQMQLLRDKNIVAAEVGVDLNALGYIEADQVLRALSGTKITSPFPVAPARVFESDSAHDLELTAAAQQAGDWYTGKPGATVDYFEKLWRG